MITTLSLIKGHLARVSVSHEDIFVCVFIKCSYLSASALIFSIYDSYRDATATVVKG